MLELEPALLGRGQRLLRRGETGGLGLIAGPVAAIETGIGQRLLQCRELAMQPVDLARQPVELALLLIAQALGCPGPTLGAGVCGRRSARAGFRRLRPWQIRIAAGMLDRAAVAGHDDDRGHQTVEEIAVVAHQQDGAVVIVQHFLQQIEGVEIEVVGGLVHDQEIAGRGEEAREQQPAPARRPRAPRPASGPGARRTGNRGDRRRHASGHRAP